MPAKGSCGMSCMKHLILGVVTCTVCNILHAWLKGQKNEQQNNAPNPKNNAAAGYQGLVKIKLLKGAGLHVLFYNVGDKFVGCGTIQECLV